MSSIGRQNFIFPSFAPKYPVFFFPAFCSGKSCKKIDWTEEPARAVGWAVVGPRSNRNYAVTNLYLTKEDREDERDTSDHRPLSRTNRERGNLDFSSPTHLFLFVRLKRKSTPILLPSTSLPLPPPHFFFSN